MGCEWPVGPLEHLAAPEKGSIAIGPFGSRMKADCYVEKGVALIRGTNLGHGKSLSGEFVFITSEKATELGNANLKPSDLVFPHRGAIGEVGIVPDDGRRYALSTSLMKITLDSNRAVPDFYYYYFKSVRGQSELLKNASQVGTPGISTPLKSLRECVVPNPSFAQQTDAVAILRCLDDRIDLLRKANTTLEAIAQALFKSWFVDFDPVHAKAEGREPEAMDAATAALFPSEFEASELGLIPKGWQAGTLKDVCKVHDSKRVPLSGLEREKRPGNYPYYGAASVMDYIDDYIFDGVYVLLAEDGSVATKDGFALTQYVWGRFWVNNHAHILEGIDGFSTEQLLLLLQRVRINEYITGAVQAKLSQRNMFTIPAVIPPEAVSKAFNFFVSPLFARIRESTNVIDTLAQLRDTLLPRLISGKLRLPDAMEATREVLA